MSHGMIIYSLPKVSSKSGSPLQSYNKDKIMATLNSKIKLFIRCPLVWLFTTQSFIQIGLTIAELQERQNYGNPELKKLNPS